MSDGVLEGVAAGSAGALGRAARTAPRVAGRARYAASQAARVAWYASHYAALLRIAPITPEPGVPPYKPKAAAPDPRATRRAFMALFEQDLANIEAGLYPAPRGPAPRAVMRGLARSRLMFADAPEVARRRRDKGAVEVRAAAAPAARDGGQARYPTYYVQNFHYQTDGWFSRRSARLYDTQVEVLFTGAADAMRRLALAEVARALRGRDQRDVRLLDVACGTGRFLEQALDAFPRLAATGLDLSPAYVEEARERLAPWRHAAVVEANAEAAPFEPGAFDVVTCVYLFHELPPRVRPIVAAEMARITAPGGLVVLADSIQQGDDPNLDQMLEVFPRVFHEPYYAHYATDDLAAHFTAAGLTPDRTNQGFLTKVMTFRKPG